MQDVARRVILLVSLVACCLLPASADAGQTVGTTTGAVDGTATDKTGAVLPDVAITISSTALMGARTTLTDAEGLYRFPALPPGDYTLVFTLEGFGAVRRENVHVGVGFTATIDVTLDIATLQEQTIVERQSPVIDKQSTAIVDDEGWQRWPAPGADRAVDAGRGQRSIQRTPSRSARHRESLLRDRQSGLHSRPRFISSASRTSARCAALRAASGVGFPSTCASSS